MPGMSGVDVCRHVRTMGFEFESLPIIMISANHKEEQVVEGLVAGSNDYMFKPFKRKELVARINSQLRVKVCPLSMESRLLCLIYEVV